MLLPAALTLMPLIFVLILLIRFKMPADIAGIFGLLLTLFLAIVFFETSIEVIPRILLAGVVGSLPVGLVIAASIVQITLMAECGALARLVAFIKTLTPKDKAVQVLLINVGMGILLTGLGAASVAIFPPLLMALGYSTSAAILLPAMGYVALCMYALLGIPAVIMAHFTAVSLQDTALLLASFMPCISTAVAFACLHIAGGFSLMRRGFWPAILTGLSSGFVSIGLAHMGLITVTAILAGVAIVISLLAYVKIRGGILQDNGVLNNKDLAAKENFSLPRAASPWLILLVFSLILNTPALPFFNFTFNTLAMPVEIIPSHPEKIRLFWQAYFWVAISTLISLPLLKIPHKALWGKKGMLTKGIQRAWRTIGATAVYFCIAYVMNHSGTLIDWQIISSNNMILILASAATDIFGTYYPAATPFIGVLAGFIGGSASSAVAMFTKLHMTAGAHLQVSPLLLATANGIGGGLASAISPSKLFGAASSIDAPEAVNAVIGYAFVLTLCITCLCALLTHWWI